MTSFMVNKSKLISLAVSASLLVGSSGYLFYDNARIKDLNEKQRLELNSLDLAKSNLHKEIKLMKDQLEQYKGKNNELDKLVNDANKEIVLKEQNIKRLIADNSSLKRIQGEVYDLRKLNGKYLSRIQELEQQLLALSGENQSLKSDNYNLKERLLELEERNQFLERKVSLASVLRVENVFVLGEKKTKSGKYLKSKLKKADRFLVTFDVVENKVAAPGEKTIYVKVSDPKGNLIQNSESGIFLNSDENVEMSYTQKFSVNYNNDKQKHMVPIELNGKELDKGNYIVEFYCEGHFCGLNKIKVK
jgi:hypothetical protein